MPHCVISLVLSFVLYLKIISIAILSALAIQKRSWLQQHWYFVRVNMLNRYGQLWVKDLPKVLTWWLKWDSNLQPVGRRHRTLPLSHYDPQVILWLVVCLILGCVTFCDGIDERDVFSRNWTCCSHSYCTIQESVPPAKSPAGTSESLKGPAAARLLNHASHRPFPVQLGQQPHPTQDVQVQEREHARCHIRLRGHAKGWTDSEERDAGSHPFEGRSNLWRRRLVDWRGQQPGWNLSKPVRFWARAGWDRLPRTDATWQHDRPWCLRQCPPQHLERGGHCREAYGINSRRLRGHKCKQHSEGGTAVLAVTPSKHNRAQRRLPKITEPLSCYGICAWRINEHGSCKAVVAARDNRWLGDADQSWNEVSPWRCSAARGPQRLKI